MDLDLVRIMRLLTIGPNSDTSLLPIFVERPESVERLVVLDASHRLS